MIRVCPENPAAKVCFSRVYTNTKVLSKEVKFVFLAECDLLQPSCGDPAKNHVLFLFAIRSMTLLLPTLLFC